MMFGHTATEFQNRPMVKTVNEFISFAKAHMVKMQMSFLGFAPHHRQHFRDALQGHSLPYGAGD
jgi:hypothetical protein